MLFFSRCPKLLKTQILYQGSLAGMFSAARALVRPRLAEQAQVVWNKADVLRRVMAKESCVRTHPWDGDYRSLPQIDRELFEIPFHCANNEGDLGFFLGQYRLAPEGSDRKTKALECYRHALLERTRFDARVDLIEKFIYGTIDKASRVINAVKRSDEQPIVDDWIRYEGMVETYMKICGRIPPYGTKLMDSIVNMCNAGVQPEVFAKAAAYACVTLEKGPPMPKFP